MLTRQSFLFSWQKAFTFQTLNAVPNNLVQRGELKAQIHELIRCCHCIGVTLVECLLETYGKSNYGIKVFKCGFWIIEKLVKCLDPMILWDKQRSETHVYLSVGCVVIIELLRCSKTYLLNFYILHIQLL